MKQLGFQLMVVLIFICCGGSKPDKIRTEITRDIWVDLNNLLPAGDVTADIMDGVKQNPRQAELLGKLQAGVRENFDWFIEYKKSVPKGERMPYHPNLGVTKQEYKELQDLMKNVEVISTGQEQFEIEKKDSTISFRADHKLELLNRIKINLKNNTIQIDKYNLTFSDTVNVMNEDNGLKSKWKGYTWRYESPKDMNLDMLKDHESLNAIQYKFTIGRLEKNGKTFMSVTGREYVNGLKQVEFDLPLVF